MCCKYVNPAKLGTRGGQADFLLDSCSRKMYCSRVREHFNNMNARHFPRQMIDVLTDILAEAGFSPQFPKASGGADFEVEIGEDKLRLAVQCEMNARPSRMLAPSAARMSGGGVPVLGIPAAGDRMRETLRKLGWSWFDLAGNCRITVPGRLLIEKSGNPSAFKAPPGRLNLSMPQTAHLIRALLVPENAGRSWSQRELSVECSPGVSIGLTNKVVRELREEGYLEPEGPAKVRDYEGLLAAWQQKYRFDRQEMISCFTLLKNEEIHSRLAALELELSLVPLFAYASFSAADFQAPNVRQPLIWLYASAEHEEKVMQHLDAKPVDSGANLRILVPEDKGVFFKCHCAEGRLCVTNPLQTYVDLMHSGGRGAEAAEAILRQCLQPAWEKSK